MVDPAPSVAVLVWWSPAPRQVWEKAVQLPSGATVADAVQACGVLAAFPTLDLGTAVLGVWGRKTRMGHALRDGDRVEIYRPLRVDPKVARRERFNQQGARSAGLFARRRAGAKAGY